MTVASVFLCIVAVWTSDWTLVTPENGVKDDYYPLPRDAADGSFRFRFSRNADNTIGVEAFVRDDRVVVDDCKPGAITCTTWTDDCLEVFFDGDNDRNPNTRGPDWNENPTPCNAGGEYAIAANGAFASARFTSVQRIAGQTVIGISGNGRDPEGKRPTALGVSSEGVALWSCSSSADRDMTKVVRIQSEEEYN